MTDSRSPTVEEELERALRLALATAAQLADRVARTRQGLAQEARHRSDQEARQLQARLRAEGASATTRLAVLDRPEWWNRADAEQIAGMYELAAQWQHDQPAAATAIETMTRQLQDRYGIQLAAPDADPAEVRAALARRNLERQEHAGHRGPSNDSGSAVAAVLRAEQRDARAGAARPELAAAESPSSGYDSVERRESAATGYRAAGLPEATIAVAMRADVAYARPATEAVGDTRSTTPATPGGSRTHTATRTDQER